MSPGSRQRRAAILAALLVLSAIVVAWVGVPQPGALARLVGALGPAGPVGVVVVSAILLLVLVPRAVLAAAAGLTFGPVLGSVYVLAGAALGAIGAFAIGRWLGRDYVSARSRLAPLDRWLTDRGALGVAVLRILPVGPFGLVSYGLGTTGIRVSSYLLGTAVGAAPSTLAYAHLGAAVLQPGSVGFFVSLSAAAALAALSTALTNMAHRRGRQQPRRSRPGPPVSASESTN